MKRERQDLSTDDDGNWYCYIPLTTNDGRPRRRSRESAHVIDIYIRCSPGINANSEEKRDPIPHRYTWIYICMTAADLYRRKRIRTPQNMMIYAADKLGRVYSTHIATSSACIIFIRCWLLPKFSVKRFFLLLMMTSIIYSVYLIIRQQPQQRDWWLYIHCRWNILYLLDIEWLVDGYVLLTSPCCAGYLHLPRKNKKEEGMLVFCLGHRHIICDLFADVSIQYIRKLWKATKKRVSGFLSCLCCRPSRPATAAVWCWCCSVPILMMRKWWLPFFPPFIFPGCL